MSEAAVRIEWYTGMMIWPVTELRREMRNGVEIYYMHTVRELRVVSREIGEAVRGLTPEMAHIVADNMERMQAESPTVSRA